MVRSSLPSLDACLRGTAHQHDILRVSRGGEHSIRLSVSPARAFVEIVLEDDAIPFNPLEAGAPDLEPSLEERAVGGLGIHFVKKLMDDVSYERTSSGNRLVLVKKV
ncbi:ATP-binding protein [Cohnella algarum]|uniref:ATP-binding protein n=1 Tax=Cohnella algarum TaxID=2044859 RepID=UPI001967C27F|nr:ATP-binding protein [Cohnella algarum]MBN2982764.1 ATP-binding protein [Cohnella algarum]